MTRIARVVVRAHLARMLLPVGEVLGQTCTSVLGARSLAVDLDGTGSGRESSQEPEASALGVPRRIGLVAEIGVLRLRVDDVASDDRARGGERLLAYAPGDVVEAILHRQFAECHGAQYMRSDHGGNLAGLGR